MSLEHGKADQADEASPGRIAALLHDAQQALGDAEQLLASLRQAGASLGGPELAARQAAIVDAAHEEAAAILARAHEEAARVLDRAASGSRGGNSAPAPPTDAAAVLDLRDEEPAGPAPSAAPASAPAEESHDAPGSADPLDAEVRASLAAAADMARRVSGRIERLSQDLHQAPAS